MINLSQTIKEKWQVLFNDMAQTYQSHSFVFSQDANGEWKILFTTAHFTAEHLIPHIAMQDNNSERLIDGATYFFQTFCIDQFNFALVVEGKPQDQGLRFTLPLIRQSMRHDLEPLVMNTDELIYKKYISKQVADCSPCLIWVKDLSGRYTFCNQLALDKWHKTKSEVIGKTDIEIFGEKIGRAHHATDEIVLSQQKSYVANDDAAGVVHGFNAAHEQFQTTKHPLYDEDKQLTGLCGISYNVTNEAEAKNKLALISSIFDKSHEGMIITDSHSNIIAVNQAFSDITGYAKEEVIGQKPSILRSGYHDNDFYKELWATLSKDGQWQGEFANRRKDGALYPQQASINAVYDANHQVTHYFAVFSDVSERKAHEDKLYRLAFYDKLTQLPNRTYLLKTLNDYIHQYEMKSEEVSFAVLTLDIDQFKQLNDSLGYHYSDTVLQRVAKRLKEYMRHHDFISHVSGDEFCLIVGDIQSEQDIVKVIDRIMGAFEVPFTVTDVINPVHLSVCLGISIYNQDGHDAVTLIRNANTALYEAKSHGFGKFAFYKAELTTRAQSRLQIHTALRLAIENNELSLAYQPQFDLDSNKLSGFEALLRWTNAELGFVSPADFIPVAEQTGLMRMIGSWVLRTACAQGRAWLDAGYEFGRIAVNVSALQFQDENFVEHLVDILEETKLPATSLAIEITEGVLLDDTEKVIEMLGRVRALDIEIALDDFGTGYSSLSYLKGLPIHKLKIDRSFIIDVPQNAESNNIVKAIAAMASSMQIDVVVEGIEEAVQIGYLQEYGCQFGQGFYLGRPLTLDKATELLVN